MTVLSQTLEFGPRPWLARRPDPGAGVISWMQSYASARDPSAPSSLEPGSAPTTRNAPSVRADGIGTVGRCPEAVQTGEDQIETEVELAGEVVAGLAHVLGN